MRISRRTSTCLKPVRRRLFWTGFSPLMQSLNWLGGQESMLRFIPTKYDKLQKWQGSLGVVLVQQWSWHLWWGPQCHLNGVATSTGHWNIDYGIYSCIHAATLKLDQSSAWGESLNKHHLLQVQRLCKETTWCDEYLETAPRDVMFQVQ